MESINDIFELAKDIYEQYRKDTDKSSPLNGWRKKKTINSFNKLKRIVIKTMDDCDFMDSNRIIDYYRQLILTRLPKGDFGHTIATKSENLDTWFTAVVDYSINHPNQEYKCQAIIDYRNNTGINITYTCFAHDNPTKRILGFTDYNIVSIQFDHKLSESLQFQGYNINLEGNIIRNEFFKVLREDTKNFILDKITFYEERMEI